jgi:hypothetical protein
MSKVLHISNSTRGILIIELPEVSGGRKKKKLLPLWCVLVSNNIFLKTRLY